MEIDIEYYDGKIEFRVVGDGTETEARQLSENLKQILGTMLPTDIKIVKMDESHRHARHKKVKTGLKQKY